jgi:signal transduction histidine kinase
MDEAERRALKQQYAAALRNFLTDGGEAGLHVAYEIGRRAISDGFGVIDLIALHQDAQEELLREREEPASCLSAVGGSARFLAESLSPFEMAHRSFQEAVAALRRLNEMLEEEARRIAHALHDEAGQLLVSVHLAVKEVADGLPPRARDRLFLIRAPLDEVEKHLRRLSHELRPTVLDDLGLVPALEFMVQGVSSRSGIPIAVEGPKSPRLPTPVELALYRVAQEAVRNATKHAGASRVDIRLAIQTGKVRCSIKDDGKGFDVPATLDRKGDRGLGLIGMRERLNAVGGQLTIDSGRGRGTEIRITIPLGEHDADPSPSRG